MAFKQKDDKTRAKILDQLTAEAQELEMGKQGDKEISQQYGDYDNAAMTAYVQRVGQTIAAHSDHPELTWHFKVLDSPVVTYREPVGEDVDITSNVVDHFYQDMLTFPGQAIVIERVAPTTPPEKSIVALRRAQGNPELRRGVAAR